MDLKNILTFDKVLRLRWFHNLSQVWTEGFTTSLYTAFVFRYFMTEKSKDLKKQKQKTTHLMRRLKSATEPLCCRNTGMPQRYCEYLCRPP